MEEKEYTKEDCIRETKEHISKVRNYLVSVSSQLVQRALDHDKSKLESPELEMYTEFIPKIKKAKYGTEEYTKVLDQMGEALRHHYRNNSHHPEHYEDGIRGMNLLDIIEMLCDWKSAVLRNPNADIELAIEQNQKRYGYSDELKQILKNTLHLI